MQRNWIGRSEGVEFELPVVGRDDLALRVFTTRPDTGFGVTYAVIAPEHPLLASSRPPSSATRSRRSSSARSASEVERTATLEGGDAASASAARSPGRYVSNPFNGARGAGLRGGLRAHGLRHRRDHGRARRGRTRLRLRRGPRPRRRAHRRGPRRASSAGGGAWTGDGEKINSGFLDGLGRRRGDRRGDGVPRARGRRRTPRSTTGSGTGWSRASGSGAVPSRSSTARLRHRAGARGPAPRPRARRRHDGHDRSVAARDERARSSRPPVRSAAGRPSARPTRSTPSCDSSWYFLRFCDSPTRRCRSTSTRRSGCPSSSTSAASSTPSCTSSTRASTCARSIDIGLAPDCPREPLHAAVHPGHDPASDGTKMSKSKGNLVTPEEYFDDVGADALRLFHLSVGPPPRRSTGPTRPTSVIDGLRTIPRPPLAPRHDARGGLATGRSPTRDVALRRARAPDDPRGHRRPRAVGLPHRRRARSRELQTRDLQSARERRRGAAPTSRRGGRHAVQLLAPMTPHVTAELWERRHPTARRSTRPVARRGRDAPDVDAPRRSSSRSTARSGTASRSPPTSARRTRRPRPRERRRSSSALAGRAPAAIVSRARRGS